MKVYIAWSGERSKMVGEIFNEMLPYIIQSSEPFFSPEIEKGHEWLMKLTEELRESTIGIICLTRENLNEPWILFEAGALSKGLLKNHVCPFLLGLESSDITLPLSQFQDTKNTPKDVLRLMNTINECAEKPISEKVLSDSFKKWWPDFEKRIKSIPPYEEITGKDLPPSRGKNEILEEMLGILREMKRERGVSDEILANIGRAIGVSPSLRRGKTKIIVKVEPEMREKIKTQLLRNLALGIRRIETPRDKKDEFNIYFHRVPSDVELTTISLIKGVKAVITED
jgi:hypothetical protein